MKNVLYLVEDTEPAQFRYRVLNVIEALEKSSKWEARWVLTSEATKEDLSDIDLMVILRQAAKDRKVLDLIDFAHEKGIKVVFDLDDLIFSYKDLPVLMKSTGSKNVFYWSGYVWGIRRIAKRVDGFIVTNDFLGQMLKKVFKKPYTVISNSLNSKQVEMADEILADKVHNGFKIGYFSGSPTHNKDLQMVEPEILKFLNDYKNAKFVMVGYMELSNKMQEMVKKGKAEVVKLVDYKKLMKLIAKVDVNIAPLLINDFTNSKSELKFFEAGIVETTTIASPTYAFSKVISDGKNGFLAEPGKWYAKLEYLYKNSSENVKIAKNARKYAIENYYGKKFLEEVEASYSVFVK